MPKVSWTEEQLGAGSLFGGHLADIPQPHLRKFDDQKLRRRVRVRIHRFDGVGVHFHASLDEETNPLWNPGNEESPGRWQTAWDDEGYKGRYFSHALAKLPGAVAYVQGMAKKHFPDATHRLVYALDDDRDWDQKYPTRPHDPDEDKP